MVDYIVFFGLVFIGLLAYLACPNPKPPRKSDRSKCESYIEMRLYDALEARGYAVTTQVACGRYRIDMALVGPRIAIECDGKDYHSSPAQKAHDRLKNAYLRSHGWTVLRFSGRQINGNLRFVLKRIEREVSA